MIGERVMRVIHERSNEIILQESSRSKLRPECKFLDVKLDEDEPSNGF